MGSLGAMAFFMNSGGVTVPQGVIVGWPSTAASIPSGWARETALDDRFVKEISNTSTDPGVTGGSADHTHAFPTHTHSWSHGGTHAWGSYSHSGFGGTSATKLGPTHAAGDGGLIGSPSAGAGAGTYSTESVQAPHLTIIFIKSTGVATGIPVNALALSVNNPLPTGFTRYANATNRLLRGATAGADGGATSGTGDSHSHTSIAHTHVVGTHEHTVTFPTTTETGPNDAANSTGSSNAGDYFHSHTNATSAAGGGFTTGSASPGTGIGDLTPPWRKIEVVQNTTSVVLLPAGIIGWWLSPLAQIPTGWKLCDGLEGRPNLSSGKYTRAAASAAEINTLGGATTHGHSGSSHGHSGVAHSHSGGASGGPSSSSNILDSGNSRSGPTHSHSPSSDSVTSTITDASASVTDANNDPANITAAYIQYQG